MTGPERFSDTGADWIRGAVRDESLASARLELAIFATGVFTEVWGELRSSASLDETERNASEAVLEKAEAWGVSVLFQIGAQLLSAAADLTSDGRHYAAAALIRQVVEVEYLAWAFETKDHEAMKWLRSTKDERLRFFTPAKLRKAAGDRFRAKDYSYHCEFGGHPTPESGFLFLDDPGPGQFLLADLLGHVGRIWDHFVGWARSSPHGAVVLDRNDAMMQRFGAWKSSDPLTTLPPPP